jgi:hypothetical protein
VWNHRREQPAEGGQRWFRVQGLGSRVRGLGSRVVGVEVGVKKNRGLDFRV